MAVKVILEGQLDETVRDGDVLASTLDEGATVGDGLHVRLTSVDKHRTHRALGLVSGQRVRVTVEVIGSDDVPVADAGTVLPLGSPERPPALLTGASRWAELVDKVDRRRHLEAAGA